MGKAVLSNEEAEAREKARRIVIVCGYGCNLDSPLMPYLNRVADFCREKRPDMVIFCGGATQRRTFPGRTEAGVMYGYLYDMLHQVAAPPDWHPAWFTEDESYTTFENIRDAAAVTKMLHAADEASSFRGRGEKITVFCEATRALKVDILVRHFLPRKEKEPRVHLEAVSWELGSPLKELVGTIQTWLSICVPFLNMLLRWQRIRKSKTR